MKINITKKEYRLLVEMLAVADWMIHSNCTEQEAHHKKYDELRNKIYSVYREFNADDLITPSDEGDAYRETDELLESVHDAFISEYNDEIFWEELTHRLALRDVLNVIGEDNYTELDFVDKIMQIEDAKEPYVEEFECNGLKNLTIDNRASVKLSVVK